MARITRKDFNTMLIYTLKPLKCDCGKTYKDDWQGIIIKLATGGFKWLCCNACADKRLAIIKA